MNTAGATPTGHLLPRPWVVMVQSWPRELLHPLQRLHQQPLLPRLLLPHLLLPHLLCPRLRPHLLLLLLLLLPWPPR